MCGIKAASRSRSTLYAFRMPKHDHCCVDSCSNTRSRTQLIKKRSHVYSMQWFQPYSIKKRAIWEAQIRKGRVDFVFGPGMRVCSNHFVDSRPTVSNPYPTLYLTPVSSHNKWEQFGKM